MLICWEVMVEVKKVSLVVYGILLLGIIFATWLDSYLTILFSLHCILRSVLYHIYILFSYVKKEKSTKNTDGKIHIFSVATGLLYERFLR